MQGNQHTQEIKERLPIEEVVSRYVKLEKSGINMKGLCPFHNEKSPSFFVAPHRGSFMCFGCGKKGDIFTFLQEIEGIEFFDALKQLAEQAGVTLDLTHKENKQKKDAYTLLEKACLTFEQFLSKNIEAQEYLTSRGLTESIIKKFRIGFVPDEWSLLHDELKKSFEEKDILLSGLVIKNESGRLYDRFRGRIMFPIFDQSGKVIAFTGRVLDSTNKEIPKYVNSPETELFSKSHVLYGLNFAKQSIRKHNFVILVEGQMDVIMSHQVGYPNAVASSGTAFTTDQLAIISKLTPNLLIAFDSDSAGVQATAKVWEMALVQNLDIKIVYYEDAKDPADIIKEDPELWKEMVKNSIHIIEFVARLIAKIPDERKRLKSYQEKIIPLLKRVQSFSEKNFFIDKVGQILSINSSIIWSDLSIGAKTEYQRQVYQTPEKMDYLTVLSTYLSFLEKEKPGVSEKIDEFLVENSLVELEKVSIDDTQIFEIENLHEENPEKLKENFKETCSQYFLIQMRNHNKKLKNSLHDSTENENAILNEIKKNNETIKSILDGSCEFIKNML